MKFSDYLWIVLTIFSLAAYSLGLFAIIVRLLADRTTALWSKLCWTVFLIAVPVVGVTIHVITRRGRRRVRASRTAFDVPSTPTIGQPIRYHRGTGHPPPRPLAVAPVAPPEHRPGTTNGHTFTPPHPFEHGRAE